MDEVVNLHNGEHYARKEFPWRKIPEWRINESEFEARVKKEVGLVKKVRHVRSPIPAISLLNAHYYIRTILYRYVEIALPKLRYRRSCVT
jgi:hypothetical protein